MVGKHGLRPSSRRVFPNEFAISPTNGTGTFTIPAPVYQRAVALSGLEWSYDVSDLEDVPDAIAGRIRITSGGQEFVNFDVTSPGAGFQDYDPPIRFPGGQSVSLIIDPGGIGVTGKIRPKAHWVD